MFYLLIPSFLLCLFSVFTVFGIKHSVMWSQLIYILISFLGYFVIKKIGRHFFQINAKTIYWFFVGLLVLTFFVGLEVKGSRRWIDFYFYKFQASEFLKIFFIIFFSELLVNKFDKFNHLSLFLKSLFYFILPVLIIFKQPDLGNALVYVVIFSIMIIMSDIPKKYFLSFILFCVSLIPFSWFILQEYQRHRILSFINPGLDTQGTAYNMIQAVITVGSGQFSGRGLGLGTQSRLFFLPENLTDFAYSSLVEQFGFIGGFIVIILYGVIIGYLIQKLIKYYYQKDFDGKKKFLYISGLLSYIVFQVVVNIGMNMGLLPVAGIALPFISYGGSSVLALMIGFALIP